MKRYVIRGPQGIDVAVIEAQDLRYVERGIDFQPNMFNGYHAIELVSGQHPVLNLPIGWSIASQGVNE